MCMKTIEGRDQEQYNKLLGDLERDIEMYDANGNTHYLKPF
jgi:hypothetical protein